MKKWLLISVFVVMIISFGATFYIQHQAFSEQKLTMKSNFNKKENKSNQQIKDLRDKNSELEKTIKANQDKTNALQTELDTLKADKEETVSTNQEVVDNSTNQSATPIAPPEESNSPSTDEQKNNQEVTTNSKPVQGVDIPTYKQWAETRKNNGEVTAPPARYAVEFGLKLEEVDLNK